MTRQPDIMQLDTARLNTMRLDTARLNTAQFETIPRETIPRQSDGHMVRATLSCPQPDTTVCTVTGRVDLFTAPILTETLTEAVHDDHRHLVIDLSAATVLDPAGFQAVFEALDRYDIAGHLAVVVDSSSEAITSPETTALVEILDKHDDLASALLACASASISTVGRHRAKGIHRSRARWKGSVV